MRDKAGDGDGDGNLLYQKEQLHPHRFQATNGGLAGGWKLKRQNTVIEQCGK